MKIIPLSECPQFAQSCAAWSYGEWVCQEIGQTLKNSVSRYENTAQNMNISFPKTWVAVIENRPVGMVSLKETEHEDRQDLSPWLASLYVHSSYRRQGIAEQLCTHIFQEAKELNFKHIYLFTHSSAPYYSKLGFEDIGRVSDPSGRHADGEVLMRKTL